jgi:hypothetical protein
VRRVRKTCLSPFAGEKAPVKGISTQTDVAANGVHTSRIAPDSDKPGPEKGGSAVPWSLRAGTDATRRSVEYAQKQDDGFPGPDGGALTVGRFG